jgi:hypothetical protein
MEGLRDEQLELLARHRERALDALLVASAAHEGRARLRETPEGRVLLAEPPDRLVSAGVSAAAAAVEMRRLKQASADSSGLIRMGPADVFAVEVLDALKRRRLPFEPADVELVLDLGISTMRPDDIWSRSFETLSFGVAAAAKLLRDEPAPAPVLSALERAGVAIDALGLSHGGGALRRRIRELVAANVPGGLLDLSALEVGDAWHDPASEILRSHSERWEGVQDVLAHFAAARSSRPTQRWNTRMESLLAAHSDASRLARKLVELVLEIDLVPTPETRPWPPSWLLAPGNEDVVRGAVWAIGLAGDSWAVPLLGKLALRCAAASPDPSVTTALSGKVAGAAVQSLIALDTEDARNELRALLGEIHRRDLVKRIGAALGVPTTGRREQLRAEKGRAVRAKADPHPQLEQRDASRRVRAELAPRLRELGFVALGGRTFWRHRPERVEVLHVGSHRGELAVEVGVWFTAPAEPSRRDGGTTSSTPTAGTATSVRRSTSTSSPTQLARPSDGSGVGPISAASFASSSPTMGSAPTSGVTAPPARRRGAT